MSTSVTADFLVQEVKTHDSRAGTREPAVPTRKPTRRRSLRRRRVSRVNRPPSIAEGRQRGHKWRSDVVPLLSSTAARTSQTTPTSRSARRDNRYIPSGEMAPASSAGGRPFLRLAPRPARTHTPDPLTRFGTREPTRAAHAPDPALPEPHRLPRRLRQRACLALARLTIFALFVFRGMSDVRPRRRTGDPACVFHLPMVGSDGCSCGSHRLYVRLLVLTSGAFFVSPESSGGVITATRGSQSAGSVNAPGRNRHGYRHG